MDVLKHCKLEVGSCDKCDFNSIDCELIEDYGEYKCKDFGKYYKIKVIDVDDDFKVNWSKKPVVNSSSKNGKFEIELEFSHGDADHEEESSFFLESIEEVSLIFKLEKELVTEKPFFNDMSIFMLENYDLLKHVDPDVDIYDIIKKGGTVKYFTDGYGSYLMERDCYDIGGDYIASVYYLKAYYYDDHGIKYKVEVL